MASLTLDGCLGSTDFSSQRRNILPEFIDPERIKRGLCENRGAFRLIVVKHDCHPLCYRKVRAIHP